ncbi:MAG: patatin-like phospholipase family protein [Spirochaetaceae bacterium]
MIKLFDKKKSSLGLALGGGAARGFAHLGVYEVLERENLLPSFVAGTSVGSLIGALICAGHSALRIKNIAEDIGWFDLVRPTVPKRGLVKSEGLEELVDKLTEGKNIEELSIPFSAVAVDITRGKTVVLDSGPVGRAVQASCSIPGIFEPVPYFGGTLVDGGVLDNLPTETVRSMGADYVLAVDLTADLGEHENPEKGIVEIIFSSIMLMMEKTGSVGRDTADLLVSPQLSGYSFHNMDNREEMIQKGREAMEKALPRLKEDLKVK